MLDFDTAWVLEVGTELLVFGPHDLSGTLTDKQVIDGTRELWITTAGSEFVVGSETFQTEGVTWRVREGDPYTFRLADAVLQNAAEDKWAEIKARRDVVEYAGCMTPMGRVQTDLASQSRITSTKAFADLGNAYWSTGWTMENNTVVRHNRDEFFALVKAVGLHIADTHSRSQSLREFVFSRSTVEAIEAIDVVALWDGLALTDSEDDFILDHTGAQITA